MSSRAAWFSYISSNASNALGKRLGVPPSIGPRRTREHVVRHFAAAVVLGLKHVDIGGGRVHSLFLTAGKIWSSSSLRS